MSVQNLKDEMTEAYGKEALQRKKDNDALETRMKSKIESERKNVQDELAWYKNIQDGKQLYCKQCRQHWGWSRIWDTRPATSFDIKVGRHLESKETRAQGSRNDHWNMSEEFKKTREKLYWKRLRRWCQRKQRSGWIGLAHKRIKDHNRRKPWWVCDLCAAQAKMMMIEILKMTRQDLENEDYKVNGETVRMNLELSPQKKSLDKTQTTFYSDFKDTKGDKFRIKSIWESMQVSSYVEVGPMNPWCQSDMRPVFFFVRQKKNLKDGSSCTWLVLTVSVVNFFKCSWHCCRSNMEADKRTGGRTLGSEAKRDPRCTWQVWIARRSSTRQDQSILRRLWTIKKFTDALQRLCHEEWRIWEVRRPSKMLKSTFRFTRCIRQGDVDALDFDSKWRCRSCEILSQNGGEKCDFTFTYVKEKVIESAVLCDCIIIEFYLIRKRPWSRWWRTWLRRWKDENWNKN